VEGGGGEITEHRGVAVELVDVQAAPDSGHSRWPDTEVYEEALRQIPLIDSGFELLAVGGA
jgi:hypothetical protein